MLMTACGPIDDGTGNENGNGNGNQNQQPGSGNQGGGEDVPADKTKAIKFQDEHTKLLCILLWDDNEDGELSYEEAAAVTDLGSTFKGSAVIAFSELEYFTSLKKIANSAFKGCVGLIKITLPKQITSIGEEAFSECTNLKKIDIPDSVTLIDKSAFSKCSSLTSVTIGNGVTEIGWWAFQGCTSLASVTIGNSVTEIGDYAFYECKKLTSVTIPNSVTSIGQLAFCDCSRLQEVYCKATTPPTGGKYMFDGAPEQKKIYVPAESAKTYKSATGWSRYASNIVGYDF